MTDTTRSVASALNDAIEDADREIKEEFDVKSKVESQGERVGRPRRTPREGREALSLLELQANAARKQSLRSASQSRVRTDSPGSINRDFDDDAAAGSNSLSLNYEMTQSSYDALDEQSSYDVLDEQTDEEEDALLDQLEGTKETEFLEQTLADTSEHLEYEEEAEEDQSRGWISRSRQQLAFANFMVRRLLGKLITWLRSVLVDHLLASRFLLLSLVLLLPAYVLYNSDSIPSLPTFRSSLGQDGKASYSAPTALPETSEELAARLMSVEEKLQEYSSLAKDLSRENQLIRQSQKVQKTSFDTVDGLLSEVRSEVKEVKGVTKDTKGQLDKVRESVSALERQLARDLAEQKKAFDGLRAEVKGLPDADYVTNRLLEVVGAILPDRLVVRTDRKSGKVEVVPDFWQYLNSIFATKEEMVQGNKEAIKRSEDPLHSKTPTWEAFLEANERSLESYVWTRQQEGLELAGEDGAIVSRSYFMQVLERDLKALSADLDARLAGVAAATYDRVNSSSSIDDDDNSNEKDIQVKRDMGRVQQLVSSAIRKYASDALARPDFALYTGGARIDPYKTSASYMHRPAALLPRTLSKLLGNIGSSYSRPPAVAIHPDNAVGMCWAFHGSKGQLAVKLSDAILLTDIAIEHVPRENAHDPTTAPKTVEIWARVADGEAFEVFEETAAASFIGDASVHQASTRPGDGFAHLMTVSYNVFSDDGAIQTFSIPLPVRLLNVPVDEVVYRFVSNWGNQEYTCVYRVRALGQKVRLEVDHEDALGSDETIE